MTRHLLVVGAQRCGTTYLHGLLDSHPQITMARPARPEPKAFLDPDSEARGAEWYRRTYFAHATDELVLGEKSTSYIEVPEAAERAARVLGDQTMVLAMLRDPVARAVSNWAFSTDHGLEHRPLETALRENLAAPRAWDPSATSVSPFAYLERGRYADHLAPWYAAFPSRTHVLFLQDLLDDDEAVGTLFARLGVDPDFRPEGSTRLNESSEPVPDLPDDLVAAMREYFDASNDALSRRLGRELPWWPTPYPE